MAKNKGETPLRSSERLSAKRKKQAEKSEAEQQECPNDLQKKQRRYPNDPQKQQEAENLINENQPLEKRPQKKKRDMRVKLDIIGKKRLVELTKYLNLRSVGAAMDWLLPSETKGLFELTKKLSYEKGGQTLDWLLSMKPDRVSRLTKDLSFQNGGQTLDWLLPVQTKRLTEVTRELGFTEIGQTIECLLGMVTYKPLLELSNLLGLPDCRNTIQWLMNEAQPNIAAISNADLPPALPPTLPPPLPSAMNISHQFPSVQLERSAYPVSKLGDTVSTLNPHVAMYSNRTPSQSIGNQVVPDQMMAPNLNATGNQFFVSETEEPQNSLQFQSDSTWHHEIPQQNQFQTKGRDLQETHRHASSQFSNSTFGKEVSLNQPSQDRNLSHSDPLHGSNSNRTDPYVDLNSHIQIPYPAQSLTQGHPNMYNEIMQRRMKDGYSSYSGSQLQPQFPTDLGGNHSNDADLGLDVLGQEVSMKQPIQDRSLSHSDPVHASNTNRIDPYVDFNSHIQMPYPLQGLNQGHPNMYN